MDEAHERRGRPAESGRTLTRAQFLSTAAGAVAALALGRGASLPARAWAATAPTADLGAVTAGAGGATYRSRPDLHAPAVWVTGAPPLGEGPFFVGPGATGAAPGGPLIVDPRGHPVWFSPLPRGGWASNVRVQHYRGEPVLTWWQGYVGQPGYGEGLGVIMDSSYRVIARVRAAGGRQADLHEFTLSPQGTALITCFPPTVAADLSGVGGPHNGQVLESIVQEIDIATGRLVREWRSLEHVGLSESYLPPFGGPWDYLHVNSICVTRDGNLVIGARPRQGTSTLYASWNGATEVTHWRVSVGRAPGTLRPVTTVRRTGFETAIVLPDAGGYATVTALDAAGTPLGMSERVAL